MLLLLLLCSAHNEALLPACSQRDTDTLIIHTLMKVMRTDLQVTIVMPFSQPPTLVPSPFYVFLSHTSLYTHLPHRSVSLSLSLYQSLISPPLSLTSPRHFSSLLFLSPTNRHRLSLAATLPNLSFFTLLPHPFTNKADTDITNTHLRKKSLNKKANVGPCMQ